MNEQQVNDVVNYALQHNMKSIILIIVIIVIAISIILITAFGFIVNSILKSKEFNLGPLKIKNYIDNKKPGFKPDNQNNNHNQKSNNTKYIVNDDNLISINVFINILDALLSSQLQIVIKNCIDSSEKLEKIYKDYDEFVDIEFEKVFLSLKNEYYTGLLDLVIQVCKTNYNDVKCTKEYLFINDLLKDFEKRWKQLAKEITRRNGFVEFKMDPTKASGYIKEMKRCIFHCIDISKLDVTQLTQEEIEDKLNSINEHFNYAIENMFIDLSDAKIKMFEKRDYQLKKIDEITKDATNSILNGILYKFLGSTKSLEEIKLSGTAEENQMKDNSK